MRWFPLDARVTPGVGGSIWLSWRGAWQSEHEIAIWEPGHRLRMTSRQAAPFELDGKGQRVSAGPLRLVHSGFGRGAEWDDEVDGVGRGWTIELGGLRHYLAHHRGRDRHMAWVQHVVPVGADEAWARLTGANGFGAAGGLDAIVHGARYDVRPPFGATYASTALHWQPPRDFVGTVDDLNAALLRLQVESGGANRSAVGVYLSTWGVAPVVARTFESESAALVADLFASSRAVG